MTTSLSRGISSVRFFRLCSRAPPIFMKSFAIGHEFLDQAIFDTTKQRRWKQREFQKSGGKRGGSNRSRRREEADFCSSRGPPPHVGGYTVLECAAPAAAETSAPF